MVEGAQGETPPQDGAAGGAARVGVPPAGGEADRPVVGTPVSPATARIAWSPTPGGGQESRTSRVLRFGDVALTVAAAVTLATLLTRFLEPLLGTYAVTTFLGAVLLAAWRGGLWSGLAATALSALGLAFFFMVPARSPALAYTSDALRLVLFATTGVGASAVCEALRRAQRRAERSAEEIAQGAAALAASEARQRALAAAVPLLVWVNRPDGTLEFVNARLEEYIGRPAEALVGHHWLAEFAHPDDRPAFEAARSAGLAAGEAYGVERLRLRGRDGTYCWHSVRVVPERDEARAVVAWYGAAAEVDALVRQEEIERRLLAEAKAASAAKSQFLATMSHEIRTPINAILGYAELLEVGVAGPLTERQRGYVERTRASGRHLLGIIDEILDLAKVEAGHMVVERRRGGVRAPTMGALGLVRPQAAAKGVVLEDHTGTGQDAAYLGDEARVRQIVTNLLSNAVKFTGSGGRVTVRCGVADALPPSALPGGRPPGQAWPGEAEAAPAGAALPGGELPGLEVSRPSRWAFVRVEDTGIGIPPERLAAVFEPFVQVDASLTRREGGTGLGLAISRQLAHLMGGELTAESRLGEGSAFTLWLPAPGEMRGVKRGAAVPPRGVRERRRGVRLSAIGDLLGAGLPSEVVRAVADRLRADAAVPMAAGSTQSDLEDHISTFLADLAQALILMGEAERGDDEALELLADGSAIQQLISERHGAQRRRLGWTEEALGREYEILRSEIERAVRQGAPSGAGPTLDESLALIRRLLDRAEHISRLGFRGSGGP